MAPPRPTASTPFGTPTGSPRSPTTTTAPPASASPGPQRTTTAAFTGARRGLQAQLDPAGSVPAPAPEAQLDPTAAAPSASLEAALQRSYKAVESMPTRAVVQPETSTAVGTPQQYDDPGKAQEVMSAQQVQTLTTAIKSTQFGTKRSAMAALDLMERHPQTAALFEQGRLSAENVSNPEYVDPRGGDREFPRI